MYFQHLLQNTTLPCDPQDWRRVDVLATGLPLYRGRALCCDATMRSPLKANGAPQPGTAKYDGATFRVAEREKKVKYQDVDACSLTELLVLAVEVGGRWNNTAGDLVRRLAEHKAANENPVLRRATQRAWEDRWWSLLGVAAQGALAASLLAQTGHNLVLDAPAAWAPELNVLLDGQRWAGLE